MKEFCALTLQTTPQQPPFVKYYLTFCLLLVALCQVSCASVPYTPAPDSCSQELLIYHGPPTLLRHVDEACDYWVENVGPRSDLHGVAVFVDPGFRGAQAYELEPGLIVVEIPAYSDLRERMIHHEIWHVLLYRTDPDLPPTNDAHHARMRELGLCKPIEACGL